MAGIGVVIVAGLLYFRSIETNKSIDIPKIQEYPDTCTVSNRVIWVADLTKGDSDVFTNNKLEARLKIK